ncbi:MAG: hypothetical protein Q8M03_07950 [Legionella sp.]|nr:hypothetical protein [Legionella sp.]
MKTTIELLCDAFDRFKEESKSGILTFFHDNNKLLAIRKIEESLKLNDLMSIHELHDALVFIENIRVKKPAEIVRFREILSTTYLSSILDEPYIIPPEKKWQITIIKDDDFIQFLAATYDILFNYYQDSLDRANGKSPESEVTYDQKMLSESQAFRDMELTSKSAEAADKSTIFPDVKRNGVTFENKIIVPEDREDILDPFTIKTIENFTGDKVNTEGSRANKIYHFGGQILEATVLGEFTNTAVLINDNDQIVERGKTKGHINWSKDPVTQEIFATVNIEIMTCVYADYRNEKPQQFLSIGSDGKSLVALNDDDLEKIYKRCDNERFGITKNNVVPICSMKAKFKLEAEENGQYYLKTDEFSAQFNTPDLIFKNDNAIEPSHLPSLN